VTRLPARRTTVPVRLSLILGWVLAGLLCLLVEWGFAISTCLPGDFGR